jgi:hypothetical protein
MRWISKHLSRKVAKAIDKAQEIVYNGYGEMCADLRILRGFALSESPPKIGNR